MMESSPFEFINWLNGVSFMTGMAASLLLVLGLNKKGEWVWKREVEKLQSECAKESLRADRWENMVLELMGLTESALQETASELRRRRR
jgi:hypothetical protein